jgi:chromosome segregation ATPase
MMVVETKRLKTMNQELQHDSQKNAATLTNNINALQEENQKLAKDNEALENKIAELNTAAEQAAAEQAELTGKLEEAAREKERLNQQLRELQEQKKEAEQKIQDAVKVSELLQNAIAADDDGNMEGLKELLDQIEPLKELLSETEKELYESLIID